MSEERRAIHPQEPAEGEPEDVEAPGAEKAGIHPTPRRPTPCARKRGRSTPTSRPRVARTTWTSRVPAVRTTPPRARSAFSHETMTEGR
jgi:hypothetical protein